jgi:signal transduction histidine kinase
VPERRWCEPGGQEPLKPADPERQLAEELQRVQEQCDDLVRTISHDLRTPLSVLLLQAQMLQRSLAPDDRNAKRVDTIITNGLRLDTMIRDLVEVFRLENGQIQLARKPIELPAFITGIIKRLAENLAVDRVRLSFEPDLPPLPADPVRLEHVLVNLLSNALRYSDAPSEVLVHTARSPGSVSITVTDHGVGIARNELPRIFKRFYRTPDTHRQEGLGLGLTIAGMVVSAHGGKIEVESELGQGSSFRVVLPLNG